MISLLIPGKFDLRRLGYIGPSLSYTHSLKLHFVLSKFAYLILKGLNSHPKIDLNFQLNSLFELEQILFTLRIDVQEQTQTKAQRTNAQSEDQCRK